MSPNSLAVDNEMVSFIGEPSEYRPEEITEVLGVVQCGDGRGEVLNEELLSC